MGRWVTLEVQLQSRTGIIGFSTVPKNFLPSLCARRVELILIGGGIQIGRGGIEIRCGRNGLGGWRLPSVLSEKRGVSLEGKLLQFPLRGEIG